MWLNTIGWPREGKQQGSSTSYIQKLLITEFKYNLQESKTKFALLIILLSFLFIFF